MARYLVTGGAGFIGSHLVESLLGRGEQVRVFDNFSTGKRENLHFTGDLGLSPEHFSLLAGDIRDLSCCHEACRDTDFVLHQAALGSVPRSIDDPLTTNNVNILGTLNMLVAARDAGVKRFIYASSSSIYGDTQSSQEGETVVRAKVESQIPNPQSPYAVSKLTGEYYCRVFFSVYQLETISLRYFNVFGQRQDANSSYAAVIPKFTTALFRDQSPTIYGDGEQSRDFTHVDNVVQANLNACHAPGEAAGEVFNIACGQRTTLNKLYSYLRELTGREGDPLYAPPRPGDVRHSLADVAKARAVLKYIPEVSVSAGLQKSTEWFAGSLSGKTL